MSGESQPMTSLPVAGENVPCEVCGDSCDCESRALFVLLRHLMAKGKNMLDRCEAYANVAGSQKLRTRIQAELKFLNRLKQGMESGSIVVEDTHLKSSNLSHLSAILDTVETASGTTGILQNFRCGDSVLVVDVVSDHGSRWTKVIARNGLALHSIWKGEGGYGEKTIVDQARDYVTAAADHPVFYRPPSVAFRFFGGVTREMADHLMRMRVDVRGDVLPRENEAAPATVAPPRGAASDEAGTTPCDLTSEVLPSCGGIRDRLLLVCDDERRTGGEGRAAVAPEEESGYLACEETRGFNPRRDDYQICVGDAVLRPLATVTDVRQPTVVVSRTILTSESHTRSSACLDDVHAHPDTAACLDHVHAHPDTAACLDHVHAHPDTAVCLDHVHADPDTAACLDHVHAHPDTAVCLDHVHADPDTAVCLDHVHADPDTAACLDHVHADPDTAVCLDHVHADPNTAACLDHVHADPDTAVCLDHVHADPDTAVCLDHVHADPDTAACLDHVHADPDTAVCLDHVHAHPDTAVCLDHVHVHPDTAACLDHVHADPDTAACLDHVHADPDTAACLDHVHADPDTAACLDHVHADPDTAACLDHVHADPDTAVCLDHVHADPDTAACLDHVHADPDTAACLDHVHADPDTAACLDHVHADPDTAACLDHVHADPDTAACLDHVHADPDTVPYIDNASAFPGTASCLDNVHAPLDTALCPDNVSAIPGTTRDSLDNTPTSPATAPCIDNVPALPVTASSMDIVHAINLDITALVAYTSSLTNGGCRYVFKQAVLAGQASREREHPALPEMQKHMQGRKLYICESAHRDFDNIITTLGGNTEKQRAADLLARLTLVADNPSPRAVALRDSGKINARSKVIFGTGDSLRAVTLTANTGFVRAAEQQGVRFASIFHSARSLTEAKEHQAVPL